MMMMATPVMNVHQEAMIVLMMVGIMMKMAHVMLVMMMMIMTDP